ncbi:MAG: hypothetical protein V3T80_03065 [Kiloniellales bacterium]
MTLRRIFQTTLLHPLRPNYSVAVLFVCANFSEHANIDAALAAFGIEPISGGSISEAELKRIVAYLLSDNSDVFEMTDSAFRQFVNRTDISTEFLDRVLNEKELIIEEEQTEQKSLTALLNNSFGAALGQYAIPDRSVFHDSSGLPKITLLNVNLPYGILLCGSVRGLDRALHFGLYEKIYTWLMSQKVKPRTAALAEADA